MTQSEMAMRIENLEESLRKMLMVISSMNNLIGSMNNHAIYKPCSSRCGLHHGRDCRERKAKNETVRR